MAADDARPPLARAKPVAPPAIPAGRTMAVCPECGRGRFAPLGTDGDALVCPDCREKTAKAQLWPARLRRWTILQVKDFFKFYAMVAVCGVLFGLWTLLPSTPSRGEFQDRVLRKSMDRIEKAVGRPDQTAVAGGATVWIYTRATRDPQTGRTDSSAELHFLGQTCTLVNFFP